MRASLDLTWVSDALKRIGGTKRGLAKAIDIDNSSLLKTLSGERLLKVHEIPPLANYLGISRYEVLDRALKISTDKERRDPLNAIDAGVLEDLIAHAIHLDKKVGAVGTAADLALMIMSAYRFWAADLVYSRTAAPNAREIFDRNLPAQNKARIRSRKSQT